VTSDHFQDLIVERLSALSTTSIISLAALFPQLIPSKIVIKHLVTRLHTIKEVQPLICSNISIPYAVTRVTEETFEREQEYVPHYGPLIPSDKECIYQFTMTKSPTQLRLLLGVADPEKCGYGDIFKKTDL